MIALEVSLTAVALLAGFMGLVLGGIAAHVAADRHYAGKLRRLRAALADQEALFAAVRQGLRGQNQLLDLMLRHREEGEARGRIQ